VTIDVPPAPAGRPDVLGLTLALEPRVGSRVTRVEPRTAADRAGLQAGDVVTLAGKQAAPTPAQVRRAFEALPDGGAVLLAITRAMDHRLVTLTR
jgi:S1-C subfamily serine protease